MRSTIAGGTNDHQEQPRDSTALNFTDNESRGSHEDVIERMHRRRSGGKELPGSQARAYGRTRQEIQEGKKASFKENLRQQFFAEKNYNDGVGAEDAEYLEEGARVPR